MKIGLNPFGFALETVVRRLLDFRGRTVHLPITLLKARLR